MPLVGSRPSTTLMFTNACSTSIIVMPIARNAPKPSGARNAVRMPRHAITEKHTRTTLAPTRPVSSEITAKMKSVCGSGR